jgi:hypothetical protein
VKAEFSSAFGTGERSWILHDPIAGKANLVKMAHRENSSTSGETGDAYVAGIALLSHLVQL